jgi:hypothetical protein
MVRAYEVKHSEHLGYTQNVICTTPATPKVGDIVLVGDLVGYALQDEDSKGYTVVYFGPMTIQGEVSAVGTNIVPGTPLYASVSNGAVVISNTNTGRFVGFSLGSVTAGESETLKFLKEPSISASTTLGANSVTKNELSGGFSKVSLLAGAVAGDHVITGIAVGDELVAVIRVVSSAGVTTLSDITAQFVVSAGKITNTGGTDTSGNQLLVFWNDLTA